MIEELAEALATYQRANTALLATTEDQVVEEQSKTELFINPVTLDSNIWLFNIEERRRQLSPAACLF